ncbi:MAG: major capsid protein [Schleiferilactobacillus perolens]|uniref:major capsid protein n=1 Tax=Schleiferilactobacillus perolens TaxID=100468 RepID=UPI0039E94364
MPAILDLFDQKTVLDYVNNRQYPALLGDSLFPSVKIDQLDFEYLRGGSKTPIIASVSAFDTEAEIGSREASVQAAELGYIKRKMQLKEKDLIALRNPRTPAEQNYLESLVYNDLDVLVQGVYARVEKMRMEALATGKISIDENNLNFDVDYNVPSEHQVTAAISWDADGADPIKDLQDWFALLDYVPTRILTSSKVQTALIRSQAFADYFKTAGLLPSVGSLNSVLQSFGLPTVVTYDQKYRKQNNDGTYSVERYFPEDTLVAFGDDLLGQTVYGPTPEESRLLSAPGVQQGTVGNVFTTIYETTEDPIATWEKAAATALPSFPEAENVLQAKVLFATTTTTTTSK